MRKKLYVALVIFVAVVVVTCMYYNAVIPIARDIDQLEIRRVHLYLENGETTDITSSVDIDMVKEIIVQYDCELNITNFSPYAHDTVKYELNGTYDDKPWHLLLGDLNIVYEDGSHGGHRIVNSHELLLRIEECIK